MPDLVTIGETCVVLVAKSGGPLRYATEFERRIGGAESTVAVGVARLGHSAGWFSRVGDDEFGSYVVGVMRSEGVNADQVDVAAGGQTGVFFRENRTAGSSQVFYYRSNSAFTSLSPQDLNENYIASSKILHFTGITPSLSPSCLATTERAVDIAKAHSVKIVFDLNYRAKIWSAEEARPCFEKFMKKADHVLAGREDLFKLTGIAGRQEQMDYLMRLDLASVILKSGSDGTTLIDSNGMEHIPAIPVDKVVDRFGVGDAFAAGFITALIRNAPQAEAISLGNKVAGWSIRLPGNIESLPNTDELASMDNALEVANR